MLTKSKKVLLEKLYYNRETGYCSAIKLWRQANKEQPTITQADVKRYLSTQPAYAMHKQVPRPKKNIWNRWIQVSYPGQLVAIDTWFLGRGTKSQFPHALVAVDALSKFASVAPVRNLTAKNTANAMEKILDSFKFGVRSVFADMGVEFTGRPFRDMMKERGIDIVFTSGNNPSKTGLAESLIRSLRIILGRVVTGGGSGWKSVAQSVEIYNNSPHSSINNRTPNSVTMEDAGKILEFVLNKRAKEIDEKGSFVTPAKFEKNDIVRKLEMDKKGAFDKINLPRWSKTLYRIEKVLPTMPRPSYILSDPLSGATLPGSFPENSIQLRYNLNI